jgi:hypothetical protein
LAGEERRRNPRYPVDAPARVIAGHEIVEGRLRDVCRDAAFVEAPRTFPLQTDVTLDIALPDVEGPVQLRGKIIRLGISDFGGGTGMAVLFSDLTPQVVLLIDVFISQQERERERERLG